MCHVEIMMKSRNLDDKLPIFDEKLKLQPNARSLQKIR